MNDKSDSVPSKKRLSDANLEYHAKSGTYDLASMAQELIERRAHETRPVGIICVPCERHKHDTFTGTAGYGPLPKAVCPGCEAEKANELKAFVQLCAPHGKDWLTCPECAKAAGIGGEQA
ncbi:MAG: hypothetical protein JWM54_1154 [Acidobacteriaceae bacterium]|nr:hypothetical protein [Acidobacteriaceae bacterium]